VSEWWWVEFELVSGMVVGGICTGELMVVGGIFTGE
jgi:hypothetical protein